MPLEMESRIHHFTPFRREGGECRDNNERRIDYEKRALYNMQERVKVAGDNLKFTIDTAIGIINPEEGNK